MVGEHELCLKDERSNFLYGYSSSLIELFYSVSEDHDEARLQDP